MLSKRYPFLYKLAVAYHRTRRKMAWIFNTSITTYRQSKLLPTRIFKHQSPLIRKLGDVDMQLQHNKATNLKIAAACINGVIIKPGETFSLWKLIKNPTARRGFKKGLLISNGKPVSGVGGGLCQMANLLFWMFLHSPLKITEHYHHSVDLFPDSGRTIPFGTGATIFYNYIDLQVTNTTDRTFQICVWVEDKYLRGEIRCDQDVPHRYSIVERDHFFLRDSKGKPWRTNKIYQYVRETRTGRVVRENLIMSNLSRVMYEPDPLKIREDLRFEDFEAVKNF